MKTKILRFVMGIQVLACLILSTTEVKGACSPQWHFSVTYNSTTLALNDCGTSNLGNVTLCTGGAISLSSFGSSCSGCSYWITYTSPTGETISRNGTALTTSLTQNATSTYFATTYGPYTIAGGTTGSINQVITPYIDANGNGVYNLGEETTSSPITLHFVVNSLPVPTITGAAASCVGSTGVTYTTETGMTGYTWSIPSGGTITAGGTTYAVSVTWSTVGSQSIKVNYTNTNGCTATASTSQSVTVNPLPVPTISGSATACIGSTTNVYSTETGMTGYTWTISAGGTITSGAGTNSITVTWNSTGAQTVAVTYTNTNLCVPSLPTTKNITVNELPTPIITGGTSYCQGTTGVVYSTEASKSNYTWVVSAGGTITAGAGSNAITVTWHTSGPQTVSINYSNSFGCYAATATVKNVTVNPLPVPTITGLTTVCAGTTGVTYTTESGMTGYTWTVSSGGTITAGSSTNVITVSWNTNGAETVTVNYTDPNGCMAIIPTSKSVTVKLLSIPTITGSAIACMGSTGVVYSTEEGMTGYTWTISAGGSITSGTGTNSIIVTWNSTGPQTVTVIYSNSFGCTASSPTTKNVTVNPLPTPTITGATSSCQGTTGVVYSTEASMSNYTWVVSAGGTITAGTGTNSITVTWNTSGPQTVSINYSNSFGCYAATATVKNVTVNPLPVPTITGLATVCAGTTGVTYTTESGMTGYTWTVSSGGTITAGSSTNVITVSWNTNGAQTVTVNYNDPNSCTAVTPTSKSVTVNVVSIPTITGSATACAGSTGIAYSTEEGMTGYTWTISAGGSITSGTGTNSIIVTWNSTGPQTVTVIYSNSFGCTASSPTTKNVTVNPLPSPTITGAASSCQGTTGVVYSTEASMSNYTWVVSAGGTITAGTGTNSITVTWNTSGPQTLSINYSNSFGCYAATATVKNVTVNPLPVPTITGAATVCAGATGVTYTTESGMTGYTWNISSGGTITAGTGTNVITVSWNTNGAQTVTVNYTNPNSCTAVTPTSKSVTVNLVLIPTITGPATACAGSTGVVYTTEEGMTGYTWTISAGGSITSGTGTNSIIVTWNATGPQSVTATYSNSFGCAASSPTNKDVTINPLPTPTITGAASSCQGITGVVYSTEASMSNYNWVVSAGGTITAGTGTNSISVTWNTSGPQTVSINYTNSFGCYAAAPTVKNVTVNTLPVPTITGLTTACAGTTGVIYTTESGMTGYAWTVSSGGTITAGSNSNVITVTWNTDGAQTVTVNYIDPNSCTAVTPTSKSVTVNPLPVPTITGLASACIGSTGNVYYTETGKTSYTWLISSGGIITSGTGTNSIIVSWNTAGPQSVSVNYNNSFECAASVATIKSIIVHPLPTPTITGPAAACSGATGLNYSTESGMTGYTWTISPGGTITSGSNTNTISVTWNTSGPQNVTVNYINENLCTATSATSKTVTVNPLPVPIISGLGSVCIGTTGVAYSTEEGMTGYSWTISSGGIITSGNETNAILVNWNTAGPQTISISYTNSNNCTAATPTIISVTVQTLPVPTITGAISVCAGSTSVNYYTEPGMTAYTWSVSSGGNLTSGGTTNSILVTWNTIGENNVTVNYANTNSCVASTPTIHPVTVNPLPTPTITGNAQVCEGTSGVVYTTESGKTNYTWAVSSGCTITGGSSTNSVTVTWAAYGAQTISVNYNNEFSCSAAAPYIKNVTVDPLPAPISLSLQYALTDVSPSWVPVTGTLGSGYSMCLNPATTYYYIDINALSLNVPIQSSTLNPFTLSGPNAALITYYAGLGVTGPGSGWQGAAWNIIHGNAPMYYLRLVGSDYQLIDGIQYQTDGTIAPFRVNGNYPQGTYTLNGSLTGSNTCTSIPFNVSMSFSQFLVPSITGPVSVCEVSTGNVYNTESGMLGYAWTVSGGSFTGSGNSISVDWGVNGTGHVTVNYSDVNGCTALAPTDKTITINPLPVPGITGTTTVCTNATGNVYITEAGMSNYNWTVGSGGTITSGGTTSSNSVTVTWTASGSKSVSVGYTNTNSCTSANATILPVSVTPLPTPEITGPASACLNSTGNVYTTESGKTNYLWNVSSGGTITAGGTSGSNTVTVTWTTTGEKTISVNYFDNGCTAAVSTNYSVTVNTLPVPSITGQSSVCLNSTGNTYTTESGMSDYQWIIPAGATITAGGTSASNSVTITWIATGNKTLSVNYNNGNSCTAASASNFAVMVNALPVPEITGPASVCANTSENVYTTEPGMTNYLWTVSAGGTVTSGGTSSSNSITITWNTPGANSVSVNYLNSNLCTATTPTSYPVNVISLPVPALTGPSSVCVNSTGNMYTTQGGMSNYSWFVSPGGTITAGGTSTSNNITITWNSTGPQNVSVSYNNSICTSAAPANFLVSVNSLASPTISGPASACAGSTGKVYTTESGMTNYVWTISAGGIITAGGTSTSNSVTVTWNTVGPQSVSLIYTNTNGCASASTTVFPVTINPLPVPAITGPSSICALSTNNIYTTQAGKSNYLWSVSPGGTITAGGTTTSNSISVTWNTPGPQSVMVNYSDANGCSAMNPVSFPVTVNSLPTPSISGPSTSCLNSTGNVYTTEAGMTNYLWTISAGGTVTAGGTSTSNSVTITWNTTGPASVSVNYHNPSGCTAPGHTNYPVFVNQLPVASISGPNTGCVNANGNVYTTQSGMTNYIWTVSSGGTITAGGTFVSNTVTVTWNSILPQEVTVMYTNENGCSATTPTVYPVNINPLPPPTITGPATVCASSAGNTYTTNSGMVNYLWTISAGGTITGGGTTASNTITVTWNVAGPQNVSVNYTTINGCTADNPAVFPVLVNSLPAPTLSGPQSMCAGTSGYVYTTEVGMSNYSWDIAPGGVITSGGSPNSPNIMVEWTTAGSKWVNVNYTNGYGCNALTPTILPVVVGYLPSPIISGPTSMCQGSVGNLYFTQSGKSNYEWSISSGGIITSGGGQDDDFVTIAWIEQGSQTVRVNYTANNCAALYPTVFPVYVNSLPTAALSGPTTVCEGTAGNTYTTNSGMSSYSWNISAGGVITSGGTSADNTITITWFTAGNKSVGVNFTNTSGCQSINNATVAVTVNQLPIPSLTGTINVCENSTGNVYTTQAGMTNYSWNINTNGTIISGGSSTDNSITVNWNTAGDGTVSVNYTNPAGCTTENAGNLAVNIHALPVATITGPASLCISNIGHTYSTQTGMNNYQWIVSEDGSIISGGGVSNSTITIVWNTPGTHFVGVSYTNSNGCTTAVPTSFEVHVNTLPEPTITGPTSVCATSTGNIYQTEPGMSNYTWSIPLGGIVTAGGGITSNSVTIKWLTAGDHTITVNYINPNGCTAPIASTFSVIVHALPVPVINGPAILCNNNAPSIYTTQPGMSNYLWTVSPGGTVISGGSGSSSNIVITWNNPGNHIVSVNYTDANGCTAANATMYNVTVNALSTPVLTGPSTVCAYTNGNIYHTQPGMSNYLWSVTSGGVITSGGTLDDSTITISWIPNGTETVTVSFTNQSGCISSATAVYHVTVLPSPVPVISGPTSVCAPSGGHVYTTQTGMNNYHWVVSPGGIISSGGSISSNSVTVYWQEAGIQWVKVNYTNSNGCFASSDTIYPVLVNLLPNPVITGPSEVCEQTINNIYTTEPGMSNYVWSVSPGGTITAGGTNTTNNVVISWNSAGQQAVYVSITKNGCTASNAPGYPVTVNPLPVPVITGPANICGSGGTSVYSTQPGMTNYSWTLSSGGSIVSGGSSSDNSITIVWNSTGDHYVGLSYTDQDGCTALNPSIYNVHVYTIPEPVISGLNHTCEGSVGIVYITQPGMSNYQWVISSGGTITSGGLPANNTVTVTWNTPGIQTVSVNYSNANACNSNSAAFLQVTVNPLPIPQISGPGVVCLGNSGSTYTTDAGKSNYSWVISSGGLLTSGGNSSDNTATITWQNAGSHSVSVNYTDENGCTSVSPVIYPVIVHTLPAPVINGSITACFGSSGNVYTTEAGMANYAWSVSQGGVISQGGGIMDNTVTINWNASGNQSVSLNYTNEFGCTAAVPTILPVTVYALPAPSINGLASVCVNSTNNVYTTQAGKSNYSWSVTPGGIITAGGTSTSNTVTITWNTSGPQIVSVNYINGGGCTAQSSTNYNVTVHALPVPVVNGPATVCAWSTGAIYSTQTGMTNYVWTISGDGIIVPGGPYSGNNQSIAWGDSGTGTVSVSYTNSFGCAAVSPTVYPVTITPRPSPTISGPEIVCEKSLNNVYETQPGKSNYIWTLSSGGVILSGGTSTSNSATIRWDSVGPQWVRVNYTEGSCTGIEPAETEVIVNALPIPAIIGPGSICAGSGAVQYTSEEGNSDYLWSVSPGGTIVSGGGTASNTIGINWNNVGAQWLSVTYTASGCSAQEPTMLPVNVNQLPVIDAGADMTIILGNSVMLNGSAIGGSAPYQFTWQPGNSLSNPAIANPMASPVDTTTYTLFVTDNAGCTGSDNVTITVLSSIYSISGQLTYLNQAGSIMNNVTVKLFQGTTQLMSVITDINGYYSFGNLLPGNYTIKASCSKPWGGVNSADALLILKHFAHVPGSILTGLRLIAADVNADNAVNSIDAFMATKRFVHQINSFIAGDWVFEPANISIVSTDITHDFHALCVGDINTNYIPPSVKIPPTIILGTSGSMEMKSNYSYVIPVRTNSTLYTGAISLVLTYPENLYDIEGVSITGKDQASLLYNSSKGELRISWYSMKDLFVSADDILLNINIKTKDLTRVASEDDLSFVIDGVSEIADHNAIAINEINLLYPKLMLWNSDYSIRAYPNPFKDNIAFNFTLPVEGSVNLKIMNTMGELVSELLHNVSMQATDHQLTYDASDLIPGIYIYLIEVNDYKGIFKKSGRIVRVK